MWKRMPFQPRKELHESDRLAPSEDSWRSTPRGVSPSPSTLPPVLSRPSSQEGLTANYRVSDAPTMSSVYSQDSIIAAYGDNPTETDQNQAVPPDASSPPRQQEDMPAQRNGDRSEKRGVSSPDSGTPTPFTAAAQGSKSYFSSHIPTLRRTRSNMVKTNQPRDSSKNTRWDEYLGEPTAAPTGKPAQVRPSEYNSTFGVLKNRPDLGVTCTISGPNDRLRKSSLAEKAARMGRDALALDTRPAWKGGSGRTALVDPVRDTSVPRTLNQYTAVKDARGLSGNDSLNFSDSDQSLGSEWSTTADQRAISPVSPVETIRHAPDPTKVLSLSNASANAYDSPVSPEAETPPRSYSVKVTRKPVASQSSPSSHPGRSATTNVNRVNGLEAAQAADAREPASHFSWTTYADSNADRASVKTSTSTNGKQHSEMDEPGSRFNWTTVNTTTTYQQDSPPPSPPPVPVPALPARVSSRRRPVPQHEKPPTPPPSNYHTELQLPKKPAHFAGPTSDGKQESKALPAPPKTSRAMSHVEALTVRRDNLAIQHANLRKVMNGLSQIESASPLLVDQKTRKANKIKLDEHKIRLEVVEIEEHEIGRAIARARRKAEREEGVDSGLWVRRVTG